MSDPNGNYQATVSDPLIGYTPPLAGPDFFGSGSPEGVVTSGPGATYVDTDGGSLYFKQSGTGNTGWTLVTGGGGGTTQVFFGTGDPNGSVTATRPAVFYDALGNVWSKTSSGSSNTGWDRIIG